LATAALLLLADGRLPTGGHAHSGGIEAAVADGRVRDLTQLRAFCHGRLTTVGRADAAIAAAGASGRHPWAGLDAETAARTASPALRHASRAQGHGLLRAAARAWPHPALAQAGAVHPDGPLWPVALAAAGIAAGATDVALVAAHASVTGPAWAAVRLLGLDPVAVAALLADLGPAVDAEAHAAARWANPEVTLADLPAPSAPLLELGAEDHARWETRLFAS
jgi:urease accessory protein